MPANRHAAPGRAGGWMNGPCVSGERHERPHRLVLDAQASAMRPAPNSPVWFLPRATQRRFRLTAGCPLAGPPAMTNSAWVADCVRLDRTRTPSFMSRRALPLSGIGVAERRPGGRLLCRHCDRAVRSAPRARPIAGRPVIPTPARRRCIRPVPAARSRPADTDVVTASISGRQPARRRARYRDRVANQ
jgi:hypothetical protein